MARRDRGLAGLVVLAAAFAGLPALGGGPAPAPAAAGGAIAAPPGIAAQPAPAAATPQAGTPTATPASPTAWPAAGAAASASAAAASPTAQVTPADATLPVAATASARTVTGSATATSAPAATRTAAPASDYPKDSPEKRFFDQLNDDRQRCGFGPLEQSKALDRAAAAHVHYLLLNDENGHDQTPDRPGFYGRGPGERALAAGFGAANVAEIGESLELGYPGLVSVPYHALLALWSFRAVGVAHGRAAGGGARLWAKLGWPPGTFEQRPADVVTYPCDGITGTLAHTGKEIPSPFPGDADQSWGQPVIVRGTERLRVHGVRIDGPGGPVPLRALYGDGQTRDPNGLCAQGWACAIPRVLQPDTAYRVTVVGEDRGLPFQRVFIFSTGNR